MYDVGAWWGQRQARRLTAKSIRSAALQPITDLDQYPLLTGLFFIIPCSWLKPILQNPKRCSPVQTATLNKQT